VNFDQYQKIAKCFAQYEEQDYPFYALAEEVGEFLGLMAKYKRGDDLVARFGSIDAFYEALKKEAGDILWQLSQSLEELEISMQDAAETNIRKLEDRLARGVIKGSGNSR